MRGRDNVKQEQDEDEDEYGVYRDLWNLGARRARGTTSSTGNDQDERLVGLHILGALARIEHEHGPRGGGDAVGGARRSLAVGGAERVRWILME